MTVELSADLEDWYCDQQVRLPEVALRRGKARGRARPLAVAPFPELTLKGQ